MPFGVHLAFSFVLHAAKPNQGVNFLHQQFPCALYLDTTALFKALVLLYRYWTGVDQVPLSVDMATLVHAAHDH